MKRSFVMLASVLMLIMAASPAAAAPFSLFGVRIGMPRAELDQVWQRLESGEYAVDGSILTGIRPEFDHRDRLYKLTFSFPLPLQDQFPPHMVAAAFQERLSGYWDAETLVITVRTGRGAAEVTVTDRALQQELTDHINAQVEFKLGEILKP